MKSPTVVIVGQNTMNEKKNDVNGRRMDTLEKKLDQQYKAITDKKDYVRLIDKLNSSFMKRIDRFIAANKAIATDSNSQRIKSIQNEFNIQLKNISKSNNSDAAIKAFNKRFKSFERAIKNIPQPEVKVVRTRTNNSALLKSLNTSLSKIERMVGNQMVPYVG